MRRRVNERLMLSGVTIMGRSPLTWTGVAVGQDTTLWPNTILSGALPSVRTASSANRPRDAHVNDGCIVQSSFIGGASRQAVHRRSLCAHSPRQLAPDRRSHGVIQRGQNSLLGPGVHGPSLPGRRHGGQRQHRGRSSHLQLRWSRSTRRASERTPRGQWIHVSLEVGDGPRSAPAPWSPATCRPRQSSTESARPGLSSCACGAVYQLGDPSCGPGSPTAQRSRLGGGGHSRSSPPRGGESRPRLHHPQGKLAERPVLRLRKHQATPAGGCPGQINREILVQDARRPGCLTQTR